MPVPKPGAKPPPSGKLPASGAKLPAGVLPAGMLPGKLPPLPETTSGVVTGAGSTPGSTPPPHAKDLPVLAPARRPDGTSSAPPPTVPAGRKMVDAADIDIDLETVLADEAGAREPSFKPPAAQKLPAICTYGRYEVLGRIAFGGMAEIFLGRETTAVGASRYLVIKRILPHVADDDQFVQMFLDEARLAIQLNHPNICHIYEFGELESSYFIAMEWVNGVPLGKLIRKARLLGGIPPELGVRIIAQISEALHYAHRAKDALGRPLGIVHRDVSPHNVMVAYDGQVKLLDFGIAKASSHASKTEAGVVKGKFSYMAPEQCLGKPIDARADVFALGICLYEVLTGQALYHKENEYETMRAVIHDDAPSIRETRADLPEALDGIVQRALKKKAEDRFQTAGELQMALERWLADAKKVVNAASIGELMEELYEEQIKRGPLVDSTPFGQSFQRMKPVDGLDLSKSGSQPSHPSAAGISQPSAVSQPTATGTEIVPPRKSSWLPVVLAAAVVAIGLGAGYVLFGGPSEPTATVDTAPAPEPVAEQAVDPEPAPEPAPVAAEPPPRAGPQQGTLLVESTPSGASVRVGDRAVAERTTPMSVADLPVGTHHVVVTRPGYRDWEGDVEIADGEVARVLAQLAPLPREPTAPPGRISINTRPWSKVYVGPRLLGTTPIAEVSVPSGTVRLRIVDRDGNTHTRSVRVAPGATERVFYDLGQ